MKKRIVIVANGRLWGGIVDEISHDDFVIGVDRAAYWLLGQGITPDLAVGDFDSVNPKELKCIQKEISLVKKFPPEKDFIDTELALVEAFKRNPTDILIVGASGTRRDHELAALSLLETCLNRGFHAVIRDETNEVVIVGRGRTILKKRKGTIYVSIVPITQSIIISLSQLRYKIAKKRIFRGQTIGISNEFMKDVAVIDMHEGKALVIQSRD